MKTKVLLYVVDDNQIIIYTGEFDEKQSRYMEEFEEYDFYERRDLLMQYREFDIKTPFIENCKQLNPFFAVYEGHPENLESSDRLWLYQRFLQN